MGASRLGMRTGAVVLAVLTLSGCGSDDEDPPRLDLSEDRSSADPPTDDGSDGAGQQSDGSAGGRAGPLPTSYPEVGLEFAELPETTGAERQALEAYVAYERGLRLLSRTAEPNRLITDHAEQSVLATMRSTIDYLRSNDVRYRGTATISVSLDGASARAAVLDLCTDGSDLELVTAGRARPVEGLERVQGRVVLTNTGGRWAVTQYDTLEESC